MEETEKRSKTKSRQELFKEFVIPKIIEKLEKMRAEDAEYKKVVKNEFSYSEQKALLKRLSQSKEFKQAIDGLKNEFDHLHPTDDMKKSKENKKALSASLGLNKVDETPPTFF